MSLVLLCVHGSVCGICGGLREGLCNWGWVSSGA